MSVCDTKTFPLILVISVCDDKTFALILVMSVCDTKTFPLILVISLCDTDTFPLRLVISVFIEDTFPLIILMSVCDVETFAWIFVIFVSIDEILFFTCSLSLCNVNTFPFILLISVCALDTYTMVLALSDSNVLNLFTIVPAKFKSPFNRLDKFSKTDRAAGATEIKLLISTDTLLSTYNLFTASVLAVGILGIATLLLNTASPLNVLFAFSFAVWVCNTDTFPLMLEISVCTELAIELFRMYSSKFLLFKMIFPNTFTVPFTSKLYAGLFTPIPTNWLST